METDSHSEIYELFSNILLYPECWVDPKNLYFPKFLGQCYAHKDLVIALLDGNSGWSLGGGICRPVSPPLPGVPGAGESSDFAQGYCAPGRPVVGVVVAAEGREFLA